MQQKDLQYKLQVVKAKCKFIVDNCGENMECADDGKCRCVEGYTSGSDGTCTDIDECMIGLHW